MKIVVMNLNHFTVYHLSFYLFNKADMGINCLNDHNLGQKRKKDVFCLVCATPNLKNTTLTIQYCHTQSENITHRCLTLANQMSSLLRTTNKILISLTHFDPSEFVYHMVLKSALHVVMWVRNPYQRHKPRHYIKQYIHT